MNNTRWWRSMWSSIWSRARVEREMDEELRFHMQSYAADLKTQGVPEAEALRRARLEFGGVEAHKEECRASLGLRLWDELRNDVRGGFRILRQSPVFTAVAVVSLGLGIGANTAIFTAANQLLFKPLPLPEASRLRMFSWAQNTRGDMGRVWGTFARNDQGEGTGASFPYPLYQQMRQHNSAMEDLAGFKDVNRLTARVDGEAEPVDALLVSGNFYSALGVRVEAGRALTPADDSPSANGAVVLSDAYWSRRFGRSADVLGKSIELNGVPVSIVGVNAPEFKSAKSGGTPEVFFPLSLQPRIIPNEDGSLLSQNSFWWVQVLGRLKPGVTDLAATAAMKVAFSDAFHAGMPDKKPADMPRFVLSDGSRGMDLGLTRMKKPVYLLLSVAGLVLAIACANLANLLLARAGVRQREISLRLAMGAGRWRIMRQILTECMLLAALGGALGLGLGYLGRNFLFGLFEDSWSRPSITADLDWRVFAFAFAVTSVTGLLFGIVPAWRSTQTEANAALKETSRSTASHSKVLLGKGLVVFQVALSLLLVIGAGLFLRTLMNLRSTPLGINPEHIVLFQLNPPEARYSTAQRIVLFQRIAEGLAAVPGVQRSTSSSIPLLANSMDGNCFRPDRKDWKNEGHEESLANYIGPEFFTTFALPIINGRPIDQRDNSRAPKVAVINRRMANMFFPGMNPLGHTIVACADEHPKPIEVVGVSADAKYNELRGDPPPTIYMPYTQAASLDEMTFEAKTAASAASIAPHLRAVVKAVDRDLAVLEIRTQAAQIEAILGSERMFATLTAGFGVLALVLASIGIYGVMAYTVSRRTNEIGIRMALGAESTKVLAMVLTETSILAGFGIAAGLLASFGAARLLESMLFGMKPLDPLSFAGGTVLLLAVALLAALIPAWRAARVDPMTALRHE